MREETKATWHPAEGPFVATESAVIHTKMEALFGLPDLSDQFTDEEWFGPYNVDGETQFWRYDHGRDRWAVSTASAPPRPSVHVLDPLEEASMCEAFDHARLCPPLDIPGDPNAEVTTAPFLFSGWRFCWLYYPDLARWELAARGKA